MNKTLLPLWPLCIIAAWIIRAVDYSFLRGALYEYNPLLVVWAEHLFWVVVALILFCILWLSKSRISKTISRSQTTQDLKNLSSKGWITAVCIALLWWVLGTYALTKSLFLMHFDALALPAALQKLQPLFAVLGAFLFLWETISKKYWMFFVFALIWSYLITFWFQMPNIEGKEDIILASWRALLAAFCRGTQTVLARSLSKELKFYQIAFLRLILTAVAWSLIIIGMGELWSLRDIIQTQWKIFTLIAVLSGCVALGLYYKGIQSVQASHATLYELSLPVSLELFAIFWWVWVLFTSRQWIGVIIITWSILWLVRHRHTDQAIEK